VSQKTAIVTGGGQGIGRAIALALAEDGVRTAVADINGPAAKAVADEIRSRGVAAIGLKVDVSRVEELKGMVAETAAALGGADILVNNAGILHTTAVEDVTEPEWDRLMAVNLKSAFFASQQVLPHMIRNRWGRIVNLSSLAGRMGGYGAGVGYAASKAGLIGLTQSLARKVGPHNITVNAVAPGTTESDIIRQFSAERMAQLLSIVPLGRLGKPENTADLVAFLASDKAEWITGAVIDVNGGMFMG
jgi:3-oxoacyl-[acyl-carrier protein] reductase